jgi:hypothetical protein
MTSARTFEQFYQILDTIQPDEYGCHLWINGFVGYYGIITINKKPYRVHRLALERKLGRPILPGTASRA